MPDEHARIRRAYIACLEPTANGATGAVVVGLDCGLRARVAIEAVETGDGMTYGSSVEGAPIHPDLDAPVREAAFRAFSAELARLGIDRDEAHRRGLQIIKDALAD